MNHPHRRHVRAVGWAPLALLLVLGLADSPAWASALDKLQAEVMDLEHTARSLRVRYKSQSMSKEQLGEHRLVDAQVLYSLKDYTRAAILLLDFVTKYKKSRGYPEALFFLADSLYHKRDFISAKKFLRQIVTETRGTYYQEALQRLVELSMRTGDTVHIEQYLGLLASIPSHQLKPSVPYVRAKYFFFKNQTDQALAAFRTIDSTSMYYMHSQYFLGACLVRKKDLAGASKVFSELLKRYARTKTEKHIRDLTYLALGRLFYEKNKIAQAIDMYQKIPRRSPEFDTSLYEIAWAYVKANEYQKAMRALELLVLANPESTFIPEVKVLQGNLLIRLKQWGMATDLFSKTREKFVPVYNRMKQVLAEHQDPNLFFDLLLARNVTAMGMKIQVPPLAIHWVKEKTTVKRAMHLVGDVREIQDNIRESTALVKQLERAINSPAKITIFPEFTAAKAKALEVENRLTKARMEILIGERKLILAYASGSQREDLHTLAGQRAQLEEEIKRLPTSEKGYEARHRGTLRRLRELEAEISRLGVEIHSLLAQHVAMVKYYDDTGAERPQDARRAFHEEATGIKTMIEELQTERDEIRQLIIEAKSTAGVGGPEEIAERSLKIQYRDIVKKEHQILASLRGNLSGRKAELMGILVDLMERCLRVDSVLADFDKRLEAGVEEKLSGIRTTLYEEKSNVLRYAVELADYKTQTDEVAGFLTYAGFRDVAKRFYEIVVRADVGIIDVAWALKDAKTKEVSRLVRQRKMDLNMIDDEFKEVLSEE